LLLNVWVVYLTSSIVLGDINNDGYIDIVVGNHNGQANEVLLNKGDGSFLQPQDLPEIDDRYTLSVS